MQLAEARGRKGVRDRGLEEKIERLLALGVDHGINYREVDLVASIRELTAEPRRRTWWSIRSATRCSAASSAWATAAAPSRSGNASRSDMKLDPSPLAPGNRSLTGVFFGAEVALSARACARCWTSSSRDLAQGDLRRDRRSHLSAARAAAAHAYIESRAAFGRVVLIP